MKKYDLEYWQDKLNKYNVEAMQCEEVSYDGTIMACVSGDSFGICSCSYMRWVWAKDFEELATGLKEVEMRYYLDYFVDMPYEEYSELPSFTYTANKYAKYLLEHLADEGNKPEIEEVIEYFERYDREVAAGRMDMPKLVELLDEFNGIAKELGVTFEVQIFTDLDEAIAESKNYTSMEDFDMDNLDGYFASIF